MQPRNPTLSTSESIFKRLFKLEPGEGRKVLLFALLAGLVQGGVIVGLTASDTLFLSRVGFEKLPYVFIATPFVMLAYVPAFAFLISRLGTPRTLELTLIALAVGGGGLFVWVALAPASGTTQGGIGVVYYVARIWADLCYTALYSLFWNFTDTFFDIQDAKRLFPLFSAGMAAGAMLGGGLVAVISQTIGVASLYLFWSGIALVSLPVVSGIRKRFEVLKEGEFEEETGLWDQIKETGVALSRSRFVLILVCAMFAVVFLSSINEYEYLRILSAPLSEAQLGSLLGRLLLVVNIFNILFSLFVFNRLVLSIGVGNVAVIQPLVYLAVFYFLLFQGGIGAAIFGFVAYQGILPSIEYNNQNFLFNAVPQGVKQQVRTAVEGLAEPVATALAGALLLVLAHYLPLVRVAALGFLLAGGYLGIALLLRSAYLPSLVTNLRRGWLDLSRPAVEALSGLGAAERERLRETAREGEGEIARCALRILSINDPDAGFEATLEYLKRIPADRISEARPFVEALLERAGPDATRAFLDWVDRGSGMLSARFLEEMGGHGLIMPVEVKGLIRSEEPAEVAAAVVVLWRSWDPQDRLLAAEGLVRLLEGPDDEAIAGLRTIGRLGDEMLSRFAASRLVEGSEAVRREALASLRSIVTPDSTALVPDILESLPGVGDRGQYDGLEALGKIADPTCIVRLLDLAVDFSPPVRRSVLRVLERMGLRSVPASVSVFTDPRHAYPARAIAARFLGTAASPQLDAAWPGVVERELEQARQFRSFRRTLMGVAESTSGIRILRRFYRDTQDRTVDFVLEVLHIAGRLPSFEMLSSSLRSDLPKERANALETVEQGVPRYLFKQLRPLLVDPGAVAEPSVDGASNGAASVERILDVALQSPCACVAGAAADASWVTESPELLAKLRGRLADLRGDVYRKTVVTLAAEGQEGMTPVDIMDYLAAAPFFRSLRVGDLQEIALGAEVLELEDGAYLVRAGETADRAFVVATGRGSVDGDVVEAGALLGGEALGTSDVYTSTIVSKEMTVVCVRSRPVMDLANVSSSLGVELIRHAAGVYGVRAL